MFINNYVLNGEAHGPVGADLQDIPQVGEVRWDGGFRQPYFDSFGRPSITVHLGKYTRNKGGRVPVKEHITQVDFFNRYGKMDPTWNNTSLTKEQFIHLDTLVKKAYRWNLDAAQDLDDSSSYGGFDGMATPQMEYEMMADPGQAVMDMDAVTEGRSDMPVFSGQGMPLPITHMDFWVSQRKLVISSKNPSTAFNTVMGEAAGRRIGELVEGVTIGTINGIVYGGANTALTYVNTSQVYGYLNFPQRAVKANLTAPTAGGWTPYNTLQDFLSILDQLKLNKVRGPFMVYTSNDWDKYLDADYFYSVTSGAVAPMKSLRSRLREIRGILDIKRLDLLFATGSVPAATTGPGTYTDNTVSAFTLIFVQMGDPNVARMVNGMGLTTLQWPSLAGMKLNFRVMVIKAPQLFADYYGNCGIEIAHS